MKLTASHIAGITNGITYGPGDFVVTDIFTDSRQVSYSPGLMFIALKGLNHDGHEFIRPLYNAGIRLFLVMTLPEDREYFRDAVFIVTGSTVEALQKIAAYIRGEFLSPVIGVTGSAGKTIVKEWLADIIGLEMPVIRSPRSYNSQIGVPLSVWRLDNRYRMAVFEAGISQPGEMTKLREVIRPDIGVITNIGDAHSENFSSLAEKAAEKLKLFSEVKMLIYCSDHEIIRRIIESDTCLNSKSLISWSFSDRAAPVFVENLKAEEGMTLFDITWKGLRSSFRIPFSDRASVENAITVAAVCLALKIPLEKIRSGLRQLAPVAMRMELKSGINSCLLIEDYYNSDPGSLGMALEYLMTRGSRTKTLILSDFVQSGRNEKELYTEVAALIQRSSVSRFIGIGRALSANSNLFVSGSRFFGSTEDFIAAFRKSDWDDEIILIKGARIYEFERIGNLLEQQSHETQLEINLDAVAHNLNEFRRFLHPETKIMAMMKAFAYGAGPAEISRLMEYQRASYLAVAYTDEGVGLREAGVSLPIMVMNPDPGALELMIRYNLEPEIYSFESLQQFEKIAGPYRLIDYPVHIKLDTGMHRLGFLPDEVADLGSLLARSGSLKVISVLSHLAASEDPSLDHFTRMQADRFIAGSGSISAALGYPVIRHLLNSAGIVRFPQYQFEMVRLGIGIYGTDQHDGIDLKSAGRFRTSVSQVKKVPAGEPVGYGCRDVAPHDRTIAILPVGYADGLNRRLGNRNGSLFIKGKRVLLTGNICMDMCMADVTGIDAAPGDEAEIFGPNIPLSEVAARCGTITYEILTSVPPRVKRVFYTG